MNNCRKLVYLALGLFAFPCLVYAQTYTPVIQSDHIKPPGSVAETNFFPFSAWYSGGNARAPLVPEPGPNAREAWLNDLRQIKQLGFNTVRTWVSWSATEPRPGEYHFEHLKLLLESAQQVGLKVIIQMYADSAPEWVGKKFGKDALLESQNGHRIIPQAAPGYSIDNPGVRKAVAEFYSKTAQIAVQYPNFYGWDVWSEPHIINWIHRPWVAHAQFGFNPYTQDRFRQWLRRKYHSLQDLNAAWGRHYLDWNDVSAPRYSTILSYTDFIDWKLFLYAKMAGDMRFKYDAIRRVDRTHVITAHASPPSILATPMSGEDAANDFQRARQLDYYGLSMYPKHGNHSGNWSPWMLELQPDFAYAANRQHGGFYVGELQAGQGTVGLKIGDPITPEDEREWIWTAIAAGAKAINVYAWYPMSSGFESGGYGLINLDGTLTPRAKEAGKIARTVATHAELFANSIPVHAEVALLYNPLSQMIGGYNNVGNQLSMLPSQSLIGYYRYFNEHEIPVTFIDMEELTKIDPSQYKLIIAPDSMMFTRAAAKALIDYVHAGGHLAGEARMGWDDDKGNTSKEIPGLGLAELFGVEEATLRRDDKVSIGVTDSGSAITRGLKGDALTGAFFAESLKVLPDAGRGVKVLARFDDGAPAMTVASYGRGEALYIGSFLGLARQRFPAGTNGNDRLLHGLLDWAGIQLPFVVSGASGEQAEVRLQRDRRSGDYLLFFINHTEDKRAIAVDLNLKELRMKSPRGITLKELTSDRQMAKKPTDGTMTVRADLLGKGVEVWRIEPSK